MVSPIQNDPNAILPFGFTEFKDSGQEDYAWIEGDFKAQRIFDGPWLNRLSFINALANGVYEVNGHPVDFAPAAHPEMRGISALSAHIDPKLATSVNEATGYIKHAMARITVQYGVFKGNGGSPSDPNKDNNPFIEEKIDSSIELLPIKCNRKIYTGPTSENKGSPDAPVVGFESFLDSKGNPIPLYPALDPGQKISDYEETKEETLNVIKVILNYKLSIPLVLSPRWSDIQQACSCVNSIQFTTPSGLVAEKGTLLYGGISGITKRELLKGKLAWELEHSFQYKKEGWNNKPVGDYSQQGNTFAAVIKWVPIVPRLFESYELQKVYRQLTSEEQQLLREEQNDSGVGN